MKRWDFLAKKKETQLLPLVACKNAASAKLSQESKAKVKICVFLSAKKSGDNLMNRILP